MSIPSRSFDAGRNGKYDIFFERQAKYLKPNWQVRAVRVFLRVLGPANWHGHCRE